MSTKPLPPLTFEEKLARAKKGGPGSTRRRDADIPGPGGDRARAESEERHLWSARRMNAYSRIQSALEFYSRIANERPLIAAERMVAQVTQLEQLHRFNEDPSQFTPQVLDRMKATAINNIARSEQWDKTKGHDPQDALAAITERMTSLKGKLRIEVSLDDEVVDITPGAAAAPSVLAPPVDDPPVDDPSTDVPSVDPSPSMDAPSLDASSLCSTGNDPAEEL